MQPAPLLELGAVIVGLAILARLAGKIGIPAIPLYLLAGLAFGEGGILPLVTTQEFVRIGGEIGLVLLLFMLGLEYSAAELLSTMKGSVRAGVLDIVLNYTPGLIAGLALGWGLVPAMFLGGITLVTSSSVVAKVLSDLEWIGNRETPLVLSIAVMEDLAMAVYLPILGALLLGGATLAGLGSVALAILGVAAVLAVALRVEVGLSRLIFSHSDEALLLTILGVAVVAAGLAELIDVSAAVGALLAGIVLSGPAAESARELLAPLRDLFAAIFFAFVGLSVDPSSIPPVLGVALALAAVGALTKFATGWWGGRWAGLGPRGRARAGATLIARGEFSIAIAGLAASAGLEPRLAAVSVTYVLVLAVAGPIASRVVEPLIQRTIERRHVVGGVASPLVDPEKRTNDDAS
ncbi:MAG: cation:proton antiporter [Actinomycetota bacterium]